MTDSSTSHESTLRSLGRGFVAGAISSLVARSVTHPADTIKAQLQVQGAAQHTGHLGTLKAIRQVAQSEGIAGFYRGYGVVVFGALPGSIAYFSAYETAKKLVPADSGFAGGLLVGAFAQLLAGAVFTPMDIIKERMQVQALMRGSYSYRGSWDAVTDAWSRGGARAFFRGYWLTNSVWIPWNMLYTATYEEAKRRWSRQMQCTPDELPAWCIATAAGGAAAFAGVLTHPLDVVKTRLQVLSASPEHAEITAKGVAVTLYRREGLRAFGAGLAARAVHLSFGTALSWIIYEKVKAYLA